MREKIIILTRCALLLALCVPAEAQQPQKIPRIGFLDTSTASASAVRLEASRPRRDCKVISGRDS